MTKTLTDSSTWADVAVPVDTEDADAASVETPFQTLANRTKYLLDAVTKASVTRYYSIDACEMFPGVAPSDDPWTSPGANDWYLDEDADFGSPGSDVLGGLSWRMNFGAGSGPVGTKGLYIPIHVPDGAKLVSMQVGYRQNGAAAATHFLRLWLLRRSNQGNTIDMLGDDNPPNNEQSTASTNNTFSEDFDTGATAVVNNELYRYYAAIQHFHSGAGAMSPAQEDVFEIKTARVTYTIEEIPGE